MRSRRRVPEGVQWRKRNLGSNYALEAYDVLITPILWQSILEEIDDQGFNGLPPGLAFVDSQTGNIRLSLAIAVFKED